MIINYKSWNLFLLCPSSLPCLHAMPRATERAQVTFCTQHRWRRFQRSTLEAHCPVCYYGKGDSSGSRKSLDLFKSWGTFSYIKENLLVPVPPSTEAVWLWRNKMLWGGTKHQHKILRRVGECFDQTGSCTANGKQSGFSYWQWFDKQVYVRERLKNILLF